MNKYSLIIAVVLFLNLKTTFGQEEIQLTSKDSLVQSSWIFGLGYNFVDDSGYTFDDLFAFNSQWNAVAFPSRLSVGRYFKNGIGVEAIATYNKYKEGKIIDQEINTSDKDYFAIDTRLSYDLNRLIGQTAWFDPYIGVGLGYTDANNEPRSTYNAVLGFRTWFSDRLGLDFSTSGKWRTDNTGTNHIQHAVGLVYQIGIKKGLSRKGEAKLALLEALEKEKERVNDSITNSNAAKEAEVLAKQLATEKERARLAAIEKNKADKELERKREIEKIINDLGYVYFDLNSSFLNTKSKNILNRLSVLLEENQELELKVTSHTDSRGQSTYNKWLSQRRVDRTVAYLIEQGIASNRLIAEAFGEEELLNNCDDTIYCPEEKHQVNRRSEFIISKF